MKRCLKEKHKTKKNENRRERREGASFGDGVGFGFGGREGFEVAETGFKVGGEKGVVSEGGGVDGRDLVQNNCVLGL